jgi:hypothetical protein
VRAAEAHRHAEPLGGADRDVGAQLSRRREQGQREQVGGDATVAPRPLAAAMIGRGSAISPLAPG